jgi:uncharacterized protein (UPF0332 family)
VSPEQAALLEKADRSIRAARLLTGDGLHDFAVSRAYYAMFYLAEALLLGEGLTFSKHSAVIAAFGKHFAKTERLPLEFHAHLREAQDQRNLGDYGTGDAPGAEQAGEQIRRAEVFLDATRRLLEMGDP